MKAQEDDGNTHIIGVPKEASEHTGIQQVFNVARENSYFPGMKDLNLHIESLHSVKWKVDR